MIIDDHDTFEYNIMTLTIRVSDYGPLIELCPVYIKGNYSNEATLDKTKRQVLQEKPQSMQVDSFSDVCNNLPNHYWIGSLKI